MVIDTSAIVAILFDEPDHRRYGEVIEAVTVRLVSAVTRVELSFVIEGRKREAGRDLLGRFFRLTDTDIVGSHTVIPGCSPGAAPGGSARIRKVLRS